MGADDIIYKPTGRTGVSNSFSISFDQIKDFKRKIDEAPDKIRKTISSVMKQGADQIAREAKKLAPGNSGNLARLIVAGKDDDLNYNIVSGADYSAFVEFGTRQKAVIPPGLEDFAAQFKGDGEASNGLNAKDAIFAWCKDKGIDETLWWSIFISIMVNGTAPQPFFFPAADNIEPEIISDVQKAMENAI